MLQMRCPRELDATLNKASVAGQTIFTTISSGHDTVGRPPRPARVPAVTIRLETKPVRMLRVLMPNHQTKSHNKYCSLQLYHYHYSNQIITRKTCLLVKGKCNFFHRLRITFLTKLLFYVSHAYVKRSR